MTYDLYMTYISGPCLLQGVLKKKVYIRLKLSHEANCLMDLKCVMSHMNE